MNATMRQSSPIDRDGGVAAAKGLDEAVVRWAVECLTDAVQAGCMTEVPFYVRALDAVQPRAK